MSKRKRYRYYSSKSEGFPLRRKRDGVIASECPDDGYFNLIVSAKLVCFKCHKSFKRFGDRNLFSNDRCPQCGQVMRHVAPMSAIPRKQNKWGWRRLERIYVK